VSLHSLYQSVTLPTGTQSNSVISHPEGEGEDEEGREEGDEEEAAAAKVAFRIASHSNPAVGRKDPLLLLLLLLLQLLPTPNGDDDKDDDAPPPPPPGPNPPLPPTLPTPPSLTASLNALPSAGCNFLFSNPLRLSLKFSKRDSCFSACFRYLLLNSFASRAIAEK